MDEVVPNDSKWRSIPFVPGYYINQYGHVFDLTCKQVVKPQMKNYNLPCVRLHTHGYSTTHYQTRSVPKLMREIYNMKREAMQ